MYFLFGPLTVDHLPAHPPSSDLNNLILHAIPPLNASLLPLLTPYVPSLFVIGPHLHAHCPLQQLGHIHFVVALGIRRVMLLRLLLLLHLHC